jgi:hypothetical protein
MLYNYFLCFAFLSPPLYLVEKMESLLINPFVVAKDLRQLSFDFKGPLEF